MAGIENQAKQDVETEHTGCVWGTLCLSGLVWKAWDVELGVPMAGSLEDRNRLDAFVSMLVASE